MKKSYIFLLLCLLLGARTAGWSQTLVTYQAEAGQVVAATIGTGWLGYTGSISTMLSSRRLSACC